MSKFKFNSDGWTNWITHDGSDCPCVGYYIQVEYDDVPKGRNSKHREGVCYRSGSSWRWEPSYLKILYYRVRKPLGMKQVEGLLENLPDKVPEIS